MCTCGRTFDHRLISKLRAAAALSVGPIAAAPAASVIAIFAHQTHTFTEKKIAVILALVCYHR